MSTHRSKNPMDAGEKSGVDDQEGWDAIWREVAPYCGSDDTEGRTKDHWPSTIGLPATVPYAPSGSTPQVTGYEILKELGRGGMGVVYLARQVNSERLVALKVLNEVAVTTPQMRSRFVTEGNAGLQLDHPNIVKLHRLVEDRHSGSLFLVMEYIEGENLGSRLKRGPLTDQEAAALALKLARALAHAHRRGIVHRDLKPANVLLHPANPLSHRGERGRQTSPKRQRGLFSCSPLSPFPVFWTGNTRTGGRGGVSGAACGERSEHKAAERTRLGG